MGRRYIDEFCPRCKNISTFRIKKTYGGKLTDGRIALRRIVKKCLSCQYKTISGRNKSKNTVIIRQ